MVAVPGRLIAGGGVAGSGVLGGAQTPTLSAFDARTGALLDWTVAASWTEGTVAKLAADRSTLYVQVFHKWPTGPSCHAFDLETGEERWQTTGLAHRWARLLAVHNGHLYLGPEESAKGDPRILVLDAATGSLVGHVDVDGSVETGAVRGTGSDARLVITGDFSTVAGVARDSIAELRLADGTVTDFQPAVRRNGYGHWAAGPRGVLVASEYLHRRQATPARFLAALDLVTGTPVSWPVNVDGNVSYLRYTPDGTLWMVGRFTDVNGEQRPGTAAVDAATGDLRAWAPRFNDSVANLTYDAKRHRLYACGRFTRVGRQPRQYVAAFDATTGRLLPWQVQPDNAVMDVAVDGDRVWLGGTFTRLGEQRCRRLVAVDADTGAALDTAASASDAVRRLCLAGPWLVAGGDFLRLSDAPRACLGAIDRVSGEAVPWDPALVAEQDRLPVVYAVRAWNDTVWAVGDFESTGGHPRPGLAAFAVPSGALIEGRRRPN